MLRPAPRSKDRQVTEIQPQPAPSPKPRQRRSQAERSAETRALLLDVTVECLAELGYAGTTSKIVAERAGLSRGAQLHHFGTKAQLVTGALEHLFQRRVQEFRRGLEQLPDDVDATGPALELLWSILSGPSGYAYLELVSAARTDPELRECIVRENAKIDAQVDELFAEIFVSKPGSEGFLEIGWTAIMGLMEGLALELVVRRDDARVDGVIQMLKQLAPTVMTLKKPSRASSAAAFVPSDANH